MVGQHIAVGNAGKGGTNISGIGHEWVEAEKRAPLGAKGFKTQDARLQDTREKKDTVRSDDILFVGRKESP
jgi:hypothetical protein